MFMPALHNPPARSVIMFSPLPPLPNGIADYSFEILQLLSQSMSCTVVVDDTAGPSHAPSGVLVLTLADYERQEASLAERIHIYQIGNNPDHVYMLRVMARHPGLIVLHDPCLHHLLDCATLANGDFDGYSGALETEYGASGRVLGEQFSQYRLREQRMFYDLPMIDGIVGPSRGVIVHSRYAAAKVLARAPSTDVTIVPHQYSPPVRNSNGLRPEVRRSLGVSDNEILFLSLGFVTRAKRVEDTLRALASIRHQLPPFRYVIAGELNSEEVDVTSLISGLKLDGHVVSLGYVTEADFFSLIQASDVVVNLRHPIGGETSGSMIRCMGGGACVVVVDRGPFAEIPDSCACKVSWGSGFEARLAAALLSLACNPKLRLSISENARNLMRQRNALEATVDGYLLAIDKAAHRADCLWRSSVAWEALPPSDLTRVKQMVPTDAADVLLPLWFRSGTMLTCERPCRAAAWADPLDGELLAAFGHAAEMRPLKDLTDGQRDATESPRSLDLILVQGNAKDFGATSRWLSRVNRALAFGGLLIVNVKATSAGARHPLQQIESGTRVLESYAFRVDHVTAVAPPMLEETRPDSTGTEASDERCWRAVKVSEFFATDTRQASATSSFSGATV
jgi:glycosyltransferase involved in cell wall biosynthesis